VEVIVIRRFLVMAACAWLALSGRGDDTPGISLIPRGPGEMTVRENRYTKLKEKATIDQQLGAQLPAELNFLDHEGKPVRLGDIPAGKPVLLVPAYYRCRMQCNMVLSGVFDSLKKVKFKPGNDFEVVIFSIDREEGPQDAARKRGELLETTGRPPKKGSFLEGKFDHRTVADWRFLVGGEDAINKVCDAIGYRYIRDAETGDILHGMGICFLTPELKVSHYRMGMNYPPFDVQKDLQMASQNQIGSLVDKLAFVCMKYDPHSGQYSWAVIRLVQAAAVVTIIALAFIIFGNRLIGRKAEPARVAPAAGG
jgi:protein SCO1/2